MMQVIFLRWKSVLKLGAFWTVVGVLTYASWDIGRSSHSAHQAAVLEGVGKLLTSHDQHRKLDDKTNTIEDDGDLQGWHLDTEENSHKKVVRSKKQKTKTIQAIVWDKPTTKPTKTVLFSSSNQSLEQRLQIQYLTGESLITDTEAEEYGTRRSDKFCNSYKSIGSGSEGETSDDYELVNVHIVIRHGSRSPIFSLPNHKRETIDCNFKNVKDFDPLAQRFYTAMLNLTATIKAQRKQQRMPFLPLNNKCQGAQLTGVGALQHLKLGQYLKTAYRKKLFPEFTGKVLKEQVSIKSTEYTRTFQSAMAFLYGFFDTVNIVNFPWEFTKYSSFCSTELSHLQCSCPLAQKLHTTLQKEYHKRAENKTLHSAIKKEVGKILDTPASKVPFISAILDVILGKYCSSGGSTTSSPSPSLPCSTRGEPHCFKWPTVQRLWTFLDGSGHQRVSGSTNSKYSRLVMHPLLHEIATRYQNVTHGISDSRFVLYSGHDLTITPLLGTLGISGDGEMPPFASRLALELYRSKRAGSGGGHYIRALYNGRDSTGMLRFCEREDLVDGLCPLHRFLHFVYHRDVQFFHGRNSYSDVCAAA